MALISIAMTTYNGEKFLRGQIDSILNQTYKDIELIICDDCSKDSTREILKEYEKKDSRVKLFFNEQNLGFKKNFEKAISLCNGEYVALSDQDDVWELNHLEKLLNILGNADIACGNAQLIDEKGQSLGLKLNQTDGLNYIPEKDNLIYRLIAGNGAFQGASMLIKRSFFQKALPIPEGVLFHDAWFAAASCFTNGINYTFDVINNYRQHQTQITSHKKSSYLTKIKDLIIRMYKKESYKTDRFAYIENIRSRFSVTEIQNLILDDCFKIQMMRVKKINFFKRFSVNLIFAKHYKDIYTQKNKKYMFSRMLKNLF